MLEKNPLISIVVPVYRSMKSLVELRNRLVSSLNVFTENFEIILVNDGSPSDDWPVIEALAEKDERIKGINLSRNFGQHNAIHAGLVHATGEWVVVMDCDLQDRPEEIMRLYQKAQEGFDTVLARRKERLDNVFRRSISFLFYKTMSYLTETELDSSVANFGIYKRSVIDAILEVKDYTRYLPLNAKWVGFKIATVDVEHASRVHGTTSYSFRRLLNLALDVVIAFSNKPLKLVVKLGMTISLLSVMMFVYYVVLYFQGKIVIMGWASLILSIWFLFGMLIFVLGFIGLYIGKIFDKVKSRPIFIIRDRINIPSK